MARFRSFAILAACALITLPSLAQAASAVAYGLRTINTASGATPLAAAVRAMENCSMSDSHCKLLLSCDERGAGAAALSRINGIVQSLGASCGRPTAEQARSKAMEFCTANGGTACEITAAWAD